MAVKITTNIEGVPHTVKVLKSVDPATRAALRPAVQETTQNVLNRARSIVPVSKGGRASRKASWRPGPGELKSTLRSAFSTDGLRGYVMVGYGQFARRSRRRAKYGPKLGPLTLKAHLRQEARQQKRVALQQQRLLGAYAMAVNYGSPGRGIRGAHFLDRARDFEYAGHISRVLEALRRVARAAESQAASS